MQTFSIGQSVKASRQITEGGGAGDDLARFPASSYIHAEPGDDGTVEHVDRNGLLTVRFTRTNTASTVHQDEISPA